MTLELQTALAMVTAEADPTTAMNAIDILLEEQLTTGSLLDIVRALVTLNLVQSAILADVLTARSRARIPCEPDVTRSDVLGVLGHAVAQFRLHED